jgi:hypothetical protein
MRFRRCAVAGSTVVGILVISTTLGASEAAPTAPPYTFHMDVAMTMRHFPWLHFKMQGTGAYEPGVSYAVHFTSAPWFVPKPQSDIDLSMLDPTLWPRHFTFVETGRHDDETSFDLRPIDDASLEDANVVVGPKGRARHVEMRYKDGTHIKMDVGLSEFDGFLLPATLTADIDKPHMPLSANAAFKDYQFAVARQPGAGLP